MLCLGMTNKPVPAGIVWTYFNIDREIPELIGYEYE